jgi:hypothetical protein
MYPRKSVMTENNLGGSFNASAFIGGTKTPLPPSTLAAGTRKYAVSSRPAGEDKAGFYFPDSVIDPFVQEARASARQPSKTSSSRNQPTFTLEQSREIIQAAMNEFDPELGKRTKDVFDAGFDKAVADSRTTGHKINWNEVEVKDPPTQWRIEQIPPDRDWIMMRSLPANSPLSRDGDPENKNPHAVIDYQFDGTMNSLVYMAHETGHTIADHNLQKDGKKKFYDNPMHMGETQAYLVQNALYGYIRRHPELNDKYPGITQAAAEHASNCKNASLNHLSSGLADDAGMERVHFRPMAFLAASGLYNVAEAGAADTRRKVTSAVLCEDGPKNIIEALSAAGVNSPEDMQRFARVAVAETLNGTPAISSSPKRQPTTRTP